MCIHHYYDEFNQSMCDYGGRCEGEGYCDSLFEPSDYDFLNGYCENQCEGIYYYDEENNCCSWDKKGCNYGQR